MRMLGEMAAANPTWARSPRYADRSLGAGRGFTIGWLYWFFWVVVARRSRRSPARRSSALGPGRPAVG